MAKIMILNGPNLNLLGTREPEIYGSETLQTCEEKLRKRFPAVEFDFRQTNSEGTLVDWLQEAATDCDGVVLNAGAYTHTSLALADCVRAIRVPVVEVHISNIFARETYRRHSFLSEVCRGVVCGLGLKGYELAVEALLAVEC